MSRLSALEDQHSTLDQQIAAEMQHADRDGLKISSLKAKKLRCKDEITKVRREHERVQQDNGADNRMSA